MIIRALVGAVALAIVIVALVTALAVSLGLVQIGNMAQGACIILDKFPEAEMDINSLQGLLNQEAMLANTGKDDSEERKQIHTLIRLKRDEQWRPICFGEDDCSTLMLSRCPWRIDCGE